MITTRQEVAPEMASAGPFDAQTVAAKVKTLINAQLKTILKREGLPVSGVKATMQGRIIARRSLTLSLNVVTPSFNAING